MDKKLDLLYVLGDGSYKNDIELRYSLRSIEKYCEGYGRVFIVGRKPRWVTNVEFIPCDDPYDHAHKNITHKIMTAVRDSDISEDFVFQADDHFYVRPYDFRDIAPYIKGDLPPVAKPESSTYYKSLTDTRVWLSAHSYPAKNGSQHVGMWLKKSLLLQIERDIITPGLKSPYGFEISSVMVNAMRKHLDIKPMERRDVKIIGFDDVDDLQAKIGDAFCFSIYDAAFPCGLEKILRKWYPRKSTYEKR